MPAFLTESSNKLGRVFIVLAVIALAGCSETLDIQLAPEVTVFHSNGGGRGIPLTPQDKAYAALNAWLSKHESDWYPTSGRYPGGVYIKSGSHGIQVTETLVVLYSTTHPEPKAIFAQQIGKGELSEVRNFGK